ncbi:hypothetical protein PENSPDRAFT_679673 [Peniophora sp. CONT]|nr:hypothetical protein PENSPDRAFT_679673 [Peniophora sp. CONT]
MTYLWLDCGEECRIAARDFEFGMTAPQKIFHDGRWYENAYFLYQARKFLPAYPAIADEISQCKYDEHSVSLWGRVQKYKRLGYMRPDWEEIRTDVLQDVLRLKFGRSHELREILKTIEEPYIVAVMPSNNQWGTGSDGRGENELGKALTKLRNTLRDNT